LYAEAGIRFFWRIEKDDDRPLLVTYELDVASKRYVPTGIHHGTTTLTQPFPMTLEVGALNKPPRRTSPQPPVEQDGAGAGDR
jgi:hypothetical protein